MAFKIFVFATILAASQASNLVAPLSVNSLEPTITNFAEHTATYAEHAPVIARTYEAPVVQSIVTKSVPIVAPVTKTVVSKAPSQYDYGYTVSDPYTGDHKSAMESRRGDLVEGTYSFIEADGSKRIVDYTADAAHGFNAVVRKEAVKVLPVAEKIEALPVAPVETEVPALPVVEVNRRIAPEPIVESLPIAPAPVARIAPVAPLAQFQPVAPVAQLEQVARVAPVEPVAPLVRSLPYFPGYSIPNHQAPIASYGVPEYYRSYPQQQIGYAARPYYHGYAPFGYPYHGSALPYGGQGW